MGVALGCIVPHPPILVPEVGAEELSRVEASCEGMEKLSREVIQAQPETCVIISPHSPAFSDAIAVKVNPILKGSLSHFGAPAVSFNFKNDTELAQEIISQGEKAGIPMVKLAEDLDKLGKAGELDHGVLVPLYYLKLKSDVSLVSLSISYLSHLKHYLLGAVIRKAVEKVNREVVFVASGDLSHRLIPGAPAGYSPRGRTFDLKIKELVAKKAFPDLLSLDQGLVEEAGECGLRSIITLGGVFNGYDVSSQVLSYEGPFGVGYLVAVVKPLKPKEDRDYLKGLVRAEAESRREKNERIPPLKLAKKAVESYVQRREIIKPPPNRPPCLRIRAGAFVSLKKGGVLRGCVGTTSPTQATTGHEIIKNAISSAVNDFRFSPIDPSELDELDYSVDFLEAPEEIPDESHLDPNRYGVIVVSGSRIGLLLPDLEGVKTAQEQLAFAKKKAGIPPSEPVKLYRFRVQRYH